MNPDDQLAAFLGEAPRQSRADVFTAEVMKRIERQVFLDRLTTAAIGAMVSGLVLWACSPVLNLAVSTIAPSLAPIAAVFAFAGAMLMAGGPSVWRRLGLFGR
jgi:hypothetical protein